ncbi:RWD domain-containing protein 2B [Astyanax mexicanus]|uniref:RWD domain-containing protein 2B n=1 Tax=Astyanax mexicanus TaxID=7994 RepID=UPI0020CB2F0A|nr:RWD domain-containing protein 2B [Astyanax mexicanus]
MDSSEEAESQLAEMELLVSMFPSQEELLVDQLALEELRASVEGRSDCPPSSRPSLSIRVITHPSPSSPSPHSEVSITLSCSYPLNYPTVLPELAVRCSELSRAQHSRLISDLSAYLQQVCGGGVCVLLAVDWLRENTHSYLTESPATDERHSPAVQERETFSRLWIYSHHIYNRNKRKNILEWARELNLNGFSMPGKPGIVCVEGLQRAAEEFWSRVKVLTWKRIMIRHREDIPLDASCSLDSLRKFSGFEEAAFDPHGSRGNHMDLGQLFQFLSDRGCAEIFPMFFGVEGR